MAQTLALSAAAFGEPPVDIAFDNFRLWHLGEPIAQDPIQAPVRVRDITVTPEPSVTTTATTEATITAEPTAEVTEEPTSEPTVTSTPEPTEESTAEPTAEATEVAPRGTNR